MGTSNPDAPLAACGLALCPPIGRASPNGASAGGAPCDIPVGTSAEEVYVVADACCTSLNAVLVSFAGGMLGEINVGASFAAAMADSSLSSFGLEFLSV